MGLKKKIFTHNFLQKLAQTADMFDSEITGIGAEIDPDCHARPCKGKEGLEVSDFSPDLLQFVDCWTAAVVAAEGGDGAVEEGDEGDH